MTELTTLTCPRCRGNGKFIFLGVEDLCSLCKGSGKYATRGIVADAEIDMRAVVEALGFEPDNHHNALLCPYCGGSRETIENEVRQQLLRDLLIALGELTEVEHLNAINGLALAARVIVGTS